MAAGVHSNVFFSLRPVPFSTNWGYDVARLRMMLSPGDILFSPLLLSPAIVSETGKQRTSKLWRNNGRVRATPFQLPL